MKTLQAVLSEQCNLNCTYCDVDKKSRDRIDPQLFIAEYKKQRQLNPTEKIKISFFGGEPLLQLDLIKEIVEATKHDSLVKYMMPTNALMLNEENVQFLIDNNVEVSISFDGLWQDRNRITFAGGGSKALVLKKADLIKRIPKVKCHTMVTAGCYNLLENHLFIMHRLGINPELTLVRDRGVWSQARTKKLLAGIDEIFEWYGNNPAEEMPSLIRFYLQHFITYKVRGHEQKTCGAGDSLITFADNDTLPCIRFKGDQEAIDSIAKFQVMEKCVSCEVRHYCKKGCLFEQIKNNGPIDELCDIYKHTYRAVKSLTEKLKDHPAFLTVLKKEIADA